MINKIWLGCLIAVAVIAISSCRSSKLSSAFYSDLNGDWEVVGMNGKTLDPSQTDQLVTFDTAQNIISGNAGCNRISGRMEYSPAQRNIVRFMQVASTRMACLDDNKMQLESEFLRTIDQVVRFDTSNLDRPVRMITLYGINDNPLLVLRKK